MAGAGSVAGEFRSDVGRAETATRHAGRHAGHDRSVDPGPQPFGEPSRRPSRLGGIAPRRARTRVDSAWSAASARLLRQLIQLAMAPCTAGFCDFRRFSSLDRIPGRQRRNGSGLSRDATMLRDSLVGASPPTPSRPSPEAISSSPIRRGRHSGFRRTTRPVIPMASAFPSAKAPTRLAASSTRASRLAAPRGRRRTIRPPKLMGPLRRWLHRIRSALSTASARSRTSHPWTTSPSGRSRTGRM